MKVKELIQKLMETPQEAEVRIVTTNAVQADDPTNYWVTEIEVDDCRNFNEGEDCIDVIICAEE